MQKTANFGLKHSFFLHSSERYVLETKATLVTEKREFILFLTIKQNILFVSLSRGRRVGALKQVFESRIIQNILNVNESEFVFFICEVYEDVDQGWKRKKQFREKSGKENSEMFDDFSKTLAKNKGKYVRKN